MRGKGRIFLKAGCIAPTIRELFEVEIIANYQQ